MTLRNRLRFTGARPAAAFFAFCDLLIDPAQRASGPSISISVVDPALFVLTRRSGETLLGRDLPSSGLPRVPLHPFLYHVRHLGQAVADDVPNPESIEDIRLVYESILASATTVTF